MRRTWFLLLLLLAPVAVAGEEDEAAEPAQEVTAEQRDDALKKAFAFLDENLWKQSDGGSPRKQFAAAVAGWAYLLAGEKAGRRLPSRAKEIERIRDYLERYLEQTERVYDRSAKQAGRRQPSGPPGFPDMGMMEATQFTWPLSMAAFFFAERHARGKDRRASKKMLARIVAILEAAQQPNGGWGHDDAAIPGMGIPEDVLPIPGGYPKTLLAATNCAASALGTAHRVLGTKAPESVSKAIAYYEGAQSPDGSFPYDPSQKLPARLPRMPGGSSQDPFVLDRARTAGALFALTCLGVGGENETAAKAAEVVERSLADVSEGHGSASMALLFGALLSHAQGDERWAAFRAIYFPRILAVQGEDGGFDCACRHEAFGVTCDTEPPGGLGDLPGYREGQRVYVTAIHCLILLLDRTPAKAVPPAPGPKGPVTPPR